MSRKLLEKTRRLNKVLQNSGSDPVLFSDLCDVLGEILDCNVFIISRHGKMLGYKLSNKHKECSIYNSMIDKGRILNGFNDQLLYIKETKANECQDISNGIVTIVPIICSNNRLATLILERCNPSFTEYDLVIAEYGATIVGIEIMRAKAEEAENRARKKAMVQIAISSLSYSELEAMEHVLRELNGEEGLIIASKIADRVGITRSVIVNGLRKLESAGVIESRSLGMKGTYIKIMNDELLCELNK